LKDAFIYCYLSHKLYLFCQIAHGEQVKRVNPAEEHQFPNSETVVPYTNHTDPIPSSEAMEVIDNCLKIFSKNSTNIYNI